MKQRWLALALALVMTLSPALAAQGDGDAAARFPAVRSYEGFSDVAEDAWYTPYVKLCYEAGLMSGTGDGRFSPDQTLSYAETAVLAARLHQILSGGDGTLPAAPEDWGKIVMTTADGTRLEGYGEYGEPYSWWQWRNQRGGLLYNLPNYDFMAEPPYPLPGNLKDATTDGLYDWGESQNGQPAAVEAGGRTYRGAVHHWFPVGNWALEFLPEEGTKEEADEFLSGILDLRAPRPGRWYRDAAYYLETAGLRDIPGLSYSEYAAPRVNFAQSLTAVAGDLLTPINRITDFPDIRAYQEQKADILALYNAGILTGVDQWGSFAGDKSLTRAEAAAMIARVMNPALRLSFSPQKAEERSYTLTPLDLQGGTAKECISADLLKITLPDGAGGTREAILRAGGSIVALPEGSSIVYDDPSGLVVLHRSDPAAMSGFAAGAMDAVTGELVIPFGAYAELVPLSGGLILSRAETPEGGEEAPYQIWDRSGALLAGPVGSASWPSYSEGLAPCRDGDSELWGYVDLTGNWVIEPRWERIGAFEDGYAVVGREEQYGVIDRKGETVLPFQYGSLRYLGSGFYAGGGYFNPVWVRRDGAPVQTIYKAGQVSGPIQNGYVPWGDRYLDQDLQAVTGGAFQWTGPVSAEGSAFVGMDGQVFRLTFQDGAGT